MSVLLAAAAVSTLAVDDPTPTVTVDYSGFTSVFTQVASAFAPELIAIAAIGLGIFALTWGIPKLKGFFEKTAS